MRRLRLRLRRRVLWLRRQWQHDPLRNFQASVISDEQADWLLNDEDRPAEARFYSEDTRAAEVSQAIEETERKLAAQLGRFTEGEARPALEVIGRQFGLNAIERDVLLVCLAPIAEPAFVRLYGYVQDDVNKTYATPHLALSLFPEYSPQSIQDCFAPDAPLRRFSLVNIDHRTRALSLDERIIAYLNGSNRPDRRVAEWLRQIPPTLFASSNRELVEKVCRWLRSRPRGEPSPALNLVGAAGVGRRAVARAIADRLGFQIGQLNLRSQPAFESEEAFRLLEREAILLRTVIYLDHTQLERTDSLTSSLLNRITEHLDTLLIVGSAEPLQTERRLLVVHVPRPEADVRLSLWHQALVGRGPSLNGELEALAQQFELGPEGIARAVASASERAQLRGTNGSAEISVDDLWQACRERASFDLEELAQQLVPAYGWDDIVLPEDVMRQLQELAAQVAQRHRVYEHWGFGAKLTRGRGISALFSGPSGTGKTMAAEILANHLQLDLYRVDLAGIVSKYIGETEKNLKKVFDVAERSGAILFFDEADALFSKRTDVKDAHDRYANLEVNYLLQRMEDYRGLAILATNRKSDLDRAFLRRLRFLVDFPFPDADSRRRIWQRVFPAAAELSELDYDWLARLEVAGGSIRNVALNAAFLAANEPGPIGMPHLIHATRREYSKLDKLLTEAEFGAKPNVQNHH